MKGAAKPPGKGAAPSRKGAVAAARELREIILAGAAGSRMPEELTVPGGAFGRLALFGFRSNGTRIGRSERHAFGGFYNGGGEPPMTVHDDPRLYGGRTPARDLNAFTPEAVGWSGRELQVMTLQEAGKSRAAIAAELGLTVHQVERAVKAANAKVAQAVRAMAEMARTKAKDEG